MEFLSKFLSNIWYFSTLISFYIIIGLLVAGFLKQLIPKDFIQKHIGNNSIGSVLKIVILGIPLPLCSCSVIPFMASLKKSGASKSALQTFLISTPITGIDSIMATYGAFGWFFAIYRVFSSIFISIIAGVVSMIFIKESNEKSVPKFTWSIKNKQKNIPIVYLEKKVEPSFLIRVYDYAFNQLFGDIAKSLLIGIILGSLLSTIIPTDTALIFSKNLLISYLFVLLISIPLYVCAITSIPIGITLILTGFSPGAAFVFLTAGPATSLITISIVKKMLGTRFLIIYLLSVIIGTIAFAYLMDTSFLQLVNKVTVAKSLKEEVPLREAIFALFMYVLFYKSVFLKKRKNSCCS